MKVKAKWLIFCVEYGSYVTRAGDEKHFCILHYLDPKDKRADRDWMGYIPLNKNVIDLGYTEANFSDVPGLYDVSYVPARGKRGQIEPKLTDCQFEKGFRFPSSEQILILAARRFDFEIDGKPVKGNKCFAVNTDVCEAGDGFIGYPLLEFTWSGRLGDIKAPGWFDVDLTEVRGRKGDTVLKATKLLYKSSFESTNVINAQQQPA